MVPAQSGSRSLGPRRCRRLLTAGDRVLQASPEESPVPQTVPRLSSEQLVKVGCAGPHTPVLKTLKVGQRVCKDSGHRSHL